MNTSDLEWHKKINGMQGAYAPATLVAYKFSFGIFEKWAHKSGLKSLPAEPNTVSQFIDEHAFKFAPSTVVRFPTAISFVHKLYNFPDPSKDQAVKLAMRRMFRARGRRQRQAFGLTRKLRDQVIAACSHDRQALRDRALIATAYDTLCRRSELIALLVGDLIPNADGSASVLIRRAKNDQLGSGRIAYVSPKSLAHIDKYLRTREGSPIFLFGRFSPKANGDVALHTSTINYLIKRRARQAGLKPEVVERLSGHSMRVGAAQDMAAAGIGLASIMQAGGWKSPEIVMRYIENLEVSRSGMARLYQQTEALDP